MEQGGITFRDALLFCTLPSFSFVSCAFFVFSLSVALTIDLNADVGESFGAYSIGCDAGLMRSITSASIAAGFHGGDPSVLRDTIRTLARPGPPRRGAEMTHTSGKGRHTSSRSETGGPAVMTSP